LFLPIEKNWLRRTGKFFPAASLRQKNEEANRFHHTTTLETKSYMQHIVAPSIMLCARPRPPLVAHRRTGVAAAHPQKAGGGRRPANGRRTGRDDNAALGGASSARRRSTDRARRGAARTATAAAAHDVNDKRRRRSATALAGGEGTPAAKGRRGVWDRRAATVRVFTLTAHGQAGMGHAPQAQADQQT